MASPCEVLRRGRPKQRASAAVQTAAAEALRIEAKFSRYRDDSIVHVINHSRGRPVRVDAETARLLDFANRCHDLSKGAFDITSGVLRKAWSFDGTGQVPREDSIRELLPFVGWRKVEWAPPFVTLPVGMQIDLGGIGKEYVADRISDMLARSSGGPYLVNLGGDIRASGRTPSKHWSVGVEQPENEGHAAQEVRIATGALATSGDSRRFVMHEGVRYGHILDPHTGWPTAQAPRSVTVQSDTCVEAGMMATLAILQGSRAEAFLEAQGVRFWCLRRGDPGQSRGA